MSINESKEFETINQKVKERTYSVEEVRQTVADTYREVKARRTTKAIVSMIITITALVVAVIGITALEMIGWVNDIFCIVLMCLAGHGAMFKIGYLWHEIKN